MCLKYISIVIAFVTFLHLSLQSDLCKFPIKGYYWREYDGKTPSDAFQVGVDKNKNPFYVGQVLYDTGLIPAALYEEDQTAYFLSSGPRSAWRHIKILCTGAKSNLKWVKTRSDQIHLLAKTRLVVGGYEISDDDTTSYIGRGEAYGEMFVGKALVGNSNNYSSLYTVKHSNVNRFETFEILTYINDDSFDLVPPQ